MFSLHEGRLFISDWKVTLVSAERPQIWRAGGAASLFIQINSSHCYIPTRLSASSHYEHLLCADPFLKHCHNNYKHLSKQKSWWESWETMRNASQGISRMKKTAVPQWDADVRANKKSAWSDCLTTRHRIPSYDDCLQHAEALKYGALMQVLTHLHVSVLPPLEQIETESRG